MVSTDAGGSWREFALGQSYEHPGLFSVTGTSPAEDRVLFSTSFNAPDDRSYLVVQEISPDWRTRNPDRMAALVDGLVNQLGSTAAADRQAAVRGLAACGVSAKGKLEQLARSGDPVLRDRSQTILDSYFPRWIRLLGK